MTFLIALPLVVLAVVKVLRKKPNGKMYATCISLTYKCATGCAEVRHDEVHVDVFDDAETSTGGNCCVHEYSR
jgi:hypothetical protein